MGSAIFLRMYSCSETVTNAEYLDVDYSSADFKSIPVITATPSKDINVYVSNITTTTARINFSQKYSGEIRYTATLTET